VKQALGASLVTTYASDVVLLLNYRSLGVRLTSFRCPWAIFQLPCTNFLNTAKIKFPGK
jgi:hypothetical protein